MVKIKNLIQGCKNQDRNAQEQLYRLYAAKLFGVCLKYSNNYQEAEDNIQDGFVTIFEKISQYKDEGSFEGWMKRILINTALQKHRQQKVYGLTNEDNIQEEEIEVETDEPSVDFLLECVQSLPDRYRQVFNMYVMDGFSHKEIANLLKISEGTSKSNLARARMALRDKIEKKENIKNSAQSS
ncbi:RNA polymerase sigma factor [Christiangramia forsetii]|uniref:RNA polymerase ECF-type sigma factor n=2 Tax=Christiangramia forsetii TaxID=411153 RepID=A0M6E6_CHRFK|nr:RNA polymerase sigma factor [Christiangramia forsetii]GGG30598.1 DNA-directed RNA polymerase sigma-70 factor [Christiangramia forsetii]CAL68191.1 RNA polymerase ECF-type sigma factor [Christiangramia forsetii KT0803]